MSSRFKENLMKILNLLICCALLPGCFVESTEDGRSFYNNHPYLKDRAYKLCKPLGGVYLWGVGRDKGKVKCYNNKMYDLFTGEEIER